MNVFTRKQAQAEELGALLHERFSQEIKEQSYRATRSYSEHRVLTAERNARRWMIGGIVGLVAGTAGVLTVPILLPLKTTVDHWYLADKSTGVVDRLPNFEQAVAEAPEAFRIWFAERYVESRESWLAGDAKRYHDIVEWSSNPTVRMEYEAATSLKNADTPARRLGDKGTIKIEPYGHDIKCDGTRCEVRVYYRRTESHSGEQELPKPETWWATVQFEVRPARIPAASRADNPLGMIVTYYHSEAYNAR